MWAARLRRCWRRCSAVPRASARERGRERERRTVPAWVPRCLRLRRCWASSAVVGARPTRAAPARAGRVEAVQRNVVREALQRRLRDEADDLGSGDAGAQRLRLAAAPPPPPRAAARAAGRARSWTPARCRARRAARRSRARPAGRRRPRAPCAATAFASSMSEVSSSTLNATSGGRAVTSAAPAVGMQAGGPEVGHQLAVRHPRGGARDAALAEVGALAALLRRRELPVHEHRQVQLARQPVAHRERLVVGQLAVAAAQVHDRDHVERAHARMRALVHAACRCARSPFALHPRSSRLPPAALRRACRRCGCGRGRNARRAGCSRARRARARKPRCRRRPCPR